VMRGAAGLHGPERGKRDDGCVKHDTIRREGKKKAYRCVGPLPLNQARRVFIPSFHKKGSTSLRQRRVGGKDLEPKEKKGGCVSGGSRETSSVRSGPPRGESRNRNVNA